MPKNPTKLVADLAPGERAFSFAMLAYLFLVTATFWILKPLKKALFIQFYDERGVALLGWHLEAAEAELIAKLLNMLVAIAAVALFTWLARRMRRHVLSMAFAGSFVLAFALYTYVLTRPGHLAVWSFYLFGDLFSTIMVAAFFAFLNDTVSPDAAKRLYGPIVAGGVGGGVFGALVLSTWIERLTPPQWLGVCCGLGIAIGVVAHLAGRAAAALPPASRSPDRPPEPATTAGTRNPALEGAALVLRSRYLLAIVSIVTLYEIVSTVMDFQFTSAVAHYFEGPDIGKHLSRVFAVTNVVSLLVQVLVTGAVMSRLGVGTALLVLPSTALAASVAFLAAPTLWLGSLLNTADNAFNYSINQSAREALYTTTSPDEKYKAKAFIDMFGQRFAKTIGVVASLGLSQWFDDFASVRWLSLVSIAVILLWAAAARYAGRAFRERSDSGVPSEGEEDPRPLVPRRDAEAHALRGRPVLDETDPVGVVRAAAVERGRLGRAGPRPHERREHRHDDCAVRILRIAEVDAARRLCGGSTNRTACRPRRMDLAAARTATAGPLPCRFYEDRHRLSPVWSRAFASATTFADA